MVRCYGRTRPPPGQGEECLVGGDGPQPLPAPRPGHQEQTPGGQQDPCWGSMAGSGPWAAMSA